MAIYIDRPPVTFACADCGSDVTIEESGDTVTCQCGQRWQHWHECYWDGEDEHCTDAAVTPDHEEWCEPTREVTP